MSDDGALYESTVYVAQKLKNGETLERAVELAQEAGKWVDGEGTLQQIVGHRIRLKLPTSGPMSSLRDDALARLGEVANVPQNASLMGALKETGVSLMEQFSTLSAGAKVAVTAAAGAALIYVASHILPVIGNAMGISQHPDDTSNTSWITGQDHGGGGSGGGNGGGNGPTQTPPTRTLYVVVMAEGIGTGGRGVLSVRSEKAVKDGIAKRNFRHGGISGDPARLKVMSRPMTRADASRIVSRMVQRGSLRKPPLAAGYVGIVGGQTITVDDMGSVDFRIVRGG